MQQEMSRTTKPVPDKHKRDNFFLAGCILMGLASLSIYCTGLAFALRDSTGQYITLGLCTALFSASVTLLFLGRNKRGKK